MAIITINYLSQTLGMTIPIKILYPLESQLKRHESCDVIYLLHGMSDDENIWQRKTQIEAYLGNRSVIAVMPNCHLSWYQNTQYGLHYQDFITNELPKVVGHLFPQAKITSNSQHLIGISMGGFGAITAILTSSVFSSVASLSGGLNISTERSLPILMHNKDYWTGIFGDLSNIQNSPANLKIQLKKLDKEQKELKRFYLACGTEDMFYQMNVDMGILMAQLDMNVTSHFTEGNHNWAYWDSQLCSAIDWSLQEKN